MQLLKWGVLSALLMAATAGVSYGSIVTYTANMDGASESPAAASPGTGFAQVDYDAIAQTIRVRVTFSGLITGASATHIQGITDPPGVGNAGVIVPLPSFPLGVTSGSYDHTLDLTDAATYSTSFVTGAGGTVASAEAAFIAGLGSGGTYLNIHTSTFPGGEIRGFLEVPEPTSLTLLGAGAGMLLMRRRRAAGR